jgi:sugar phosphate permease
MTVATLPNTSPSALEEATYRKVTWRLVPFLMICYVVAYLDRVNVGFAKLQMLGDLHFSETIYGRGAGLFVIGYFFFELPSNLFLHRVVSARVTPRPRARRLTTSNVGVCSARSRSDR